MYHIQQVCCQPRALADNVALPAFAAAARLLLTDGPAAVQKSIDISWPPGPQQHSLLSLLRPNLTATPYCSPHFDGPGDAPG